MIQKLMNKPLLLSPQGFEAINSIEWLPAETITPLGYELKNGVAIIPIHGLLTKRAEFFSSLMGITSYDDIFSAISDAIDDEKVEKILLDIDSSGGEVGGLFDLVDFIFNSRNQKPIYSVANDYACSAAYAIASATSHIFVNRTSCVGSIGVIATHLDVSEADKKAGLKYTTIFAGEKKNDLSRGRSFIRYFCGNSISQQISIRIKNKRNSSSNILRTKCCYCGSCGRIKQQCIERNQRAVVGYI